MCDSAPQLLYYTYIPVLVLGLILGLLVFLSNRKNLSSRLFFLLTIVTSLWVFFTMMNWQSIDPEFVEIFDKLSVIGVIIPSIFLYFSYVFPEGKNISVKKTILVFLPILPFVLLSWTSLNIEFIDTSTSDCESVAGLLYYLMPIVFLIYCFWSGFILFGKYKKGSENVKKQIKLLSIGFIIFVVWGTATNIIAPLIGSENLSFFAPIGVLIFLSFVAYAITRYQLLSIKLLASQALVFALVIIIGSELFFVENITNQILVSITLILSTGFGYMLVKSVKQEVQRKEELQVMADKLAQANDQLRKLDNAKTEFISIASHQLRTPLTSVKGFVSLIIEGSYGEVNPQVKEALVKVYSSAERLIQLVEDLLNVSRIEAGRMQFSFEKGDISRVMQEIYENFVLVAKNKKMYLDLKMPKEKIPEITMDSGKIREVVSNLVDNAFKYTEKGGVTMKAEVVDKETVRITVSDTGIGVPKEEVQNLFKKFSRGKDTTRLHASGTGLGLYVGKEIINAHNGKIWLESDGEGKGSRFIIELPINQSK